MEVRVPGVAGEGLVESRDVGDADAAVVLVRPVAAEGPEELPVGRGVRDAGDHLPLVLEADERGPVRDVADEAARAVDGVDDPSVAGRARRLAELLAEEAVFGERGGEPLAKRLFGVAVSDRDRALVRFLLDDNIAIEVAESKLTRGTGGFDHHFVAVFPLGIH